MAQVGLRRDDASHSTVPELDSAQHRFGEKRPRQLAVDGENVDQRETAKLRAGEGDPMELAPREVHRIRDPTRQVRIDHPLVFPCIERFHAGVVDDERLRWRLGRKRRVEGGRVALWHSRVLRDLGVSASAWRSAGNPG